MKADDDPHADGIAPSTVNRLLNDLRAALNAADERHRRELPADIAPCLPSFITGLCSRCGPFWTGLQTRSG